MSQALTYVMPLAVMLATRNATNARKSLAVLLHCCALCSGPSPLQAAALEEAAAGGGSPDVVLPNSDEELLDWIELHIKRLQAQGGGNTSINFNFASEYYPGGVVGWLMLSARHVPA